MLLTITTTHRPATDLGFLLHKHPDRVHSVPLAFGTATIVYPEAGDERCTAALIVDVDPVALVRGRRDLAREAVTLGQYVNDRPYAASSFLSTAMSKVFGTAMSGRSKERPDLTNTAIPLEIALTALPCRGGETVLRRIFEPLGYLVETARLPLDSTMPTWGDSRYFDVTLRAAISVRDALEHLYVLIPVLDDAKHYWVDESEVERLMRRGGTWLANHPDRELITSRALRHDRRLTRDALARLTALEPAAADDTTSDAGADDGDLDAADERASAAEEATEARLSLNDQRLKSVIDALRTSGARSVADLGCGEGRLVERILRDLPKVERVIGVDVSMHSLRRAAKRLHIDTMAPSMRSRVQLLQGALTYRDSRLLGVDAIALVEVIEHVDPSRLDAVERVVFGHLEPRTVVVTTPNVEYNARFPNLADGALRHRDHRFEWTREQFRSWTDGVGQRHHYTAIITGIGPPDDEVGTPTLMAVFTRSPATTGGVPS